MKSLFISAPCCSRRRRCSSGS